MSAVIEVGRVREQFANPLKELFLGASRKTDKCDVEQGFGVIRELVLVFVGEIISERVVSGVFLSVVYLAGSDAVAKHFYEIARRHIYWGSLAIDNIKPILGVVLVVCLVMEPRVRATLGFAFAEMRRSGAGVVFDAIPKLNG